MISSILKHNFIILAFIFSLAVILRIYSLYSLPQSFHTDELVAGYVGKYIWLYGQDIYGNIFPLYFDKFGDFRPIGIFWFSGLSALIFGLNEFAVRLPSALFGALTVVPVFFLVKELFKKEKIALLSSFFLAILPWHIVLSRATSEGVVGMFFLVISLYFAFVYIRRHSFRFLALSLIFGLLTYLFYHVYRLLLPLIFLPLPIFLSNFKQRIKITICVLIFFLVTLILSLTNFGSGRFSQVAFYKNESLTNTIEKFTIEEGQNNILMARIFHNKAVVYSREFIRQYLTYYSVDFLFEDKGLPDRYVVPNQGLLFYSFISILLLFFLYFYPFSKAHKTVWFILYLFIIMPLPAALTNEDSPNVHRSMLMILPIVIMMGIGIHTFWHNSNKKIRNMFVFVLSVILTFEFIFFWHQYSVHQQSYKPVFRNQGEKELILYVMKNRDKFKTIYMPLEGDLPLYYLFYTQRLDKLEKGTIQKRFKVKAIDNIKFVDVTCITDRIVHKKLVIEPKSLILESGDCPDNSKLKGDVIITRSDGTKAYKAIQYQ
jgi:4-amino-4-deoxy-L-arabinose transferase-like glycosyltransferase